LKDCHLINLAGERLLALPSGVLFMERQQALVVSDLHFGKSERNSRRGGPLLPPFETRDTMARLEADIVRTDAKTVVCLGDSFDDTDAGHNLPESDRQWLARLQTGRTWIWVEGNHDPGAMNLGGQHVQEARIGALTLRHIARPGETKEISGHFHPKFTLNARGTRISRRCFVHDDNRVVLPAYGTFTGGMDCLEPELRGLFANDAFAVTTGQEARVFPLPPARSATRPRLRRGSPG